LTLHLSHCVRLHGPLPLCSAFLYEGCNKVLKQNLHSINSIPNAICAFQANQILSQKKIVNQKQGIWINHYQYLINRTHSMIYDKETQNKGIITRDHGSSTTIKEISGFYFEKRKDNTNLVPCVVVNDRNHNYYFSMLPFSYFFI
jgi:hypothetical protein